MKLLIVAVAVCCISATYGGKFDSMCKNNEDKMNDHVQKCDLGNSTKELEFYDYFCGASLCKEYKEKCSKNSDGKDNINGGENDGGNTDDNNNVDNGDTQGEDNKEEPTVDRNVETGQAAGIDVDGTGDGAADEQEIENVDNQNTDGTGAVGDVKTRQHALKSKHHASKSKLQKKQRANKKQKGASSKKKAHSKNKDHNNKSKNNKKA